MTEKVMCGKGLHDLTLPNAIQILNDRGKQSKRCRQCWRDYARNTMRKRRGTPLDAPTRPWNPRPPYTVSKRATTEKQKLQLIKLILSNKKIAEHLIEVVAEMTNPNSPS